MSNIYKVTENDGTTRDIIADQNFVNQYYPNRWVLIGPEPAPPPPAPVITKLAMITRFTDAEYTGILAAAKTDVEVQGWLDRFYAANTINLDDYRTVSGMDLLVSKGLITQARANEILTAPVQNSERP